MAAEVVTKLTYEEFRQLPDDGKRYELIHGEVHFLPTPNLRQQSTLQHLSIWLDMYVREKNLGVVLPGPLDIRLNEDTAVQPDIIFVSDACAEIIKEEFIAGTPDFIVEVLSPSTSTHDQVATIRRGGRAERLVS